MQDNEIHHAWKTIIDTEIKREKEKKSKNKKRKQIKFPNTLSFKDEPTDGATRSNFKASITDVFRKTGSCNLAEEALRQREKYYQEVNSLTKG